MAEIRNFAFYEANVEIFFSCDVEWMEVGTVPFLVGDIAPSGYQIGDIFIPATIFCGKDRRAARQFRIPDDCCVEKTRMEGILLSRDQVEVFIPADVIEKILISTGVFF
jgi:hypothetical protein